MTSRSPRRSGFSLLEVVVVIAIVGILAGTAAPLVNGAIDQQRRAGVQGELADLSEALQDYYYDHGAFPMSLDATDFLGVYLVPGVDGTAVVDGWGFAPTYAYVRTLSPDIAIVRSVGPDGAYDAGGDDDIELSVPGSVPGSRRTRERMRVIVEVLASFLESGGTLTGDWTADRTNMGLGAPYHDDGFGTPFRLDAATYVLQSAGPDRVLGTADDLTT